MSAACHFTLNHHTELALNEAVPRKAKGKTARLRDHAGPGRPGPSLPGIKYWPRMAM